MDLPSDIWYYLVHWVVASYPEAIHYNNIWNKRSEALIKLKPICKASLAGCYKFIREKLPTYLKGYCITNGLVGIKDEIIHCNTFSFEYSFVCYPDRLTHIPQELRICSNYLFIMITSGGNNWKIILHFIS